MAKAYCSIDPPFSHTGYVIIIRNVVNDRDTYEFAFDYIAPKIADVPLFIQEYKDEILRLGERIELRHTCVLLAVTLSRRYPLRREFWLQPTEEFSFDQRSDLFVRALAAPAMYSLLVTPNTSEGDDRWRYSAAMPFLNTTPEASIEQFMLHSTWPVSEMAKNAAIYTLSEVREYDWVAKNFTNTPPTKVISKTTN